MVLLPVVFMEAARWCRECDLMLAIGSSLVVTPAADLPRLAKEHNSRLVIINRGETPFDEMADAVIRESIGEVLSRIQTFVG